MAAELAAARREQAVAAVILAFAAVLLFSRVQDIADAPREQLCRAESDYHVERGEALLHGVPQPGFAWAMPSYSVPNALLCGHLSRLASVAVRFAVLVACAALVFALGALLYSAVCGAGAVLLYSLAPSASESGERWLYALAVLLAAYFLVRRARAPSPGRSAALAAALGASFLMLSSLFLFPFLLAAYEWARDRRAGGARARDWAALCAAPFLFLLPWIAMNWRTAGRLVVFEDGRVDANLITGALGFVRTIGIADPRELMGAAAGRGIFPWAVEEIARHPLRYLSAVAQRALYAVSLHPLLVLLAAASVGLSREREDRRQLGLLAGYLIAVHCLMPVQPNYFVPAWPLLAVLCAGLASRWTRPSSPRLDSAAAALAHGVFAALLLFQAAVLGLVCAYPARARDAGALDRELARHPGDAWLWSARGMSRLRAGHPEQGRGDLARALALEPSRDRELDYAWALLAGGGPAARVLTNPVSGRILLIADIRERVIRAIWLDRAGRKAESAALLEETRVHQSSLPRVVVEIIASWPASSRPALIAFFSALPGFGFTEENAFAEAWLDLAATAESADHRQTALEMLAFAERLRLDPRRSRKLALGYRASGDYARSLAVLKRTKLDGAKDAEMLLDAAARAEKADRRPAALEHLEFAESLNLDEERLRGLALAYRDVGSYSRALAVLKRIDRKGGDGAGLAMDLAAAAERDDRRPDALKHLAFAEGTKLGPAASRRLAQAYRSVGDYARSLVVLKKTKMGGPRDADFLLDMAAAAAKDKQRPAALELLAHVETLSLEPERTRRLALAYRDAGEYGRALAVLKRTKMEDAKDVRLLLDLAAAAARAGRRSDAEACLALAETLSPDPERTRRLALAYRDIGGYSKALAVLKRAELGGPNDAGILLDLAVRAAGDGRRREALESLSAAEALTLGSEQLRGLARAYLALGDARGAARVRRRLGDDAGLALDRAEEAAAAGDRAGALAQLARARDLSLVDEEARRLVLLYQGLGEYAAALEAVDRRLRVRPGDPRWRNDRAVLHSLRGEREEAAADWSAAIALDPDFLPPYLGLGSLYASMDRRDDALALYRKALARRRSKEDAGVLARIAAEREKLSADAGSAPLRAPLRP